MQEPSSNEHRNQDYFQEYLGDEYKHIAEAHFRTIEAISSFFRYYLLIIAAPLAVLSAFVGFSSSPAETIINTLQELRWPILGIFIALSLVGFFVMQYVISLRMDVILYARTVNSIRKFFYDNSKIDFNSKLRNRVLPQTPSQPNYLEVGYFGPVVMTFALINALYMAAAILLAISAFAVDPETEGFFHGIPPLPWLLLLLPFGFFLLHFFTYKRYAHYREYDYLRSSTLGVDIDGVLNDHRQHFCKLFKDKVGVSLAPNDITTIPLHYCPSLEVTRENENEVFNDPRYWSKMPMLTGASKTINGARDLNLRIHIFSHRAWPNTSDLSPERRKLIHEQWKEKANSFSIKFVDRLRLRIGFVEPEDAKTGRFRFLKQALYWFSSTFGYSYVELFTKYWLKWHRIKFDRLTIESGNENVADPKRHVRNRFDISRKERIRFFVEDDLNKAVKLAYICDVVFLLDQPYNQEVNPRCRVCERECKQPTVNIPNNVLRVKSWDEIYRNLLALS